MKRFMESDEINLSKIPCLDLPYEKHANCNFDIV